MKMQQPDLFAAAPDAPQFVTITTVGEAQPQMLCTHCGERFTVPPSENAADTPHRCAGLTGASPITAREADIQAQAADIVAAATKAGADANGTTPRQLGHQAAQQAAAHADAVTHGWTDLAYAAFIAHARKAKRFTEDARLASPWVPEPPDRRAWGMVARRARMAGYIKADGFALGKTPGCHGSPKTVWLYRGL